MSQEKLPNSLKIKENKRQRKGTHFSSSSCDGDSRSAYSGSEENEKARTQEQHSSQEIKNLVNICARGEQNKDDQEFISLAYINKKLNQENEAAAANKESVSPVKCQDSDSLDSAKSGSVTTDSASVAALPSVFTPEFLS